MASIGEGHGGLRRNSGRKRKALTDRKEYLKEWNNTHKRIHLKQRIFLAWLQAKFDAGYEACSDSDFALYWKHFRIYKSLLIRKVLPDR